MEMIGKSAIWLATMGAVGALVFYLLGDRWNREARWSFRVVTASLVTALGLLLYLILTHRFEFMYVHNYSSSDLPLYYLIACLWGGQEGTLLLWIFYVSILGLFLMRMAGKLERYSMSIISLFILSILVILLKRSPFEAGSFNPGEGAGLNPLLQDFWMTIHPPIMFFGFGLTLFPFAIAVAGWLQGDYRSWARVGWVWLLGAWCALATALTMGGYWAYKVLGWGGYWAWDPVENSSLIPWIFASAGLHSLVMFKKKDSLARSAYLFSILPFIAVLWGSFLTRSGVLGDFSVHSFLDLGINSYLIACLVIFGALGTGVLLWRYRKVKATLAYESTATIDFYATIGVLAFFVAGALVLIGMSTPLWSRLGGPPSNVSLKYYFLATTPIALIILLSLALFPFLKWVNPSKPFIAPQAAIPFSIGIFTGGVAVIAGIHDPLYIVLLSLAGFAAASNAWLVYNRFRTSRKVVGAYLSHAGLAILVVGAAVSSAYERRVQVALPMGQPVETYGWNFTYLGKDLNAEHGRTPFNIRVQDAAGTEAFIASPRQYALPGDKGVMRKPAIMKFWNKDLYISPIEEVGGPEKVGEIATFKRGETKTLGGLDLTFLGFNMNGHGEGQVGKVECPVQVTGEMLMDTVRPALVSTPDGLEKVTAQFASGRYTLSVDKVDASAESVDLRLADSQNPKATPSVFWVEISEKPLINLFWSGAMLVVLGGLLSFRKRVKQLSETSGRHSSGKDRAATVPPSAVADIPLRQLAPAETVESVSP
ncbi:MAG: cytochrome c biogenesis protein CcsA [candidate division Zixibacteria bacterium]|nr:cytochrome c biogenesis protein CcsA [candidate division Zixibacteria bacterium]